MKGSAKGSLKLSQPTQLQQPPSTNPGTIQELLTTDATNVPTFLHDPFRLIKLSTSLIRVRALSGSFWLHTGLMDYLLQRDLPETEPLLVDSTAMRDIIKTLLKKSNSDQEEDIVAYKRIRQQYEFLLFQLYN